MSDVTQLLAAARAGDASATDALLPIVYAELRRLATNRFRNESPGHTLQPTALVHEVYLRLIGNQDQTWENRAHFFAAAAEAMRRILIDTARSKSRLKRGGPNADRIALSEEDTIVLPIADELLDLNEALTELERIEPEKAAVVKMKFFAGMTIREIAAAMRISDATVERYWVYARVWLYDKCKSID